MQQVGTVLSGRAELAEEEDAYKEGRTTATEGFWGGRTAAVSSQLSAQTIHVRVSTGLGDS
jgi:hypothetical protein